MGTLIATIISTTANIRRGATNSAGIIDRATVGQQLEVIQVLDVPDSREQWARIEYRDFPQAYICTRLANGTTLAQISVMSGLPESDEFKRGWNACLDAIHAALVPIRK
jgi:hypothetical protein